MVLLACDVVLALLFEVDVEDFFKDEDDLGVEIEEEEGRDDLLDDLRMDL